MRVLLIIDICGTLVKENTTHAFIKFISLSWQERAVYSLAMSHLMGLITDCLHIDLRRRMLVRILKGMSQEYLYKAAEEYAKKSLLNQGNEFILSEISKHKNSTICLASASLDPIVSAFAKLIKADCFVASQLAYDSNGLCKGYISDDATGRKWELITRNCKINVNHHFVKTYTDNSEDIDLIENSNIVYFLNKVDKFVEIHSSFTMS